MCENPYKAGEDGMTPLHRPAMHNEYVVELLLDRGADPLGGPLYGRSIMVGLHCNMLLMTILQICSPGLSGVVMNESNTDSL